MAPFGRCSLKLSHLVSTRIRYEYNIFFNIQILFDILLVIN